MQPRHQEAKPRAEAKKAPKTALKTPALKTPKTAKVAPKVAVASKVAVAPKVVVAPKGVAPSAVAVAPSAVTAKVAVAPKAVSKPLPVAPTVFGKPVAKLDVAKAAPMPAAPAAAPAAMPPVSAFKVGDHAVYPARGVAEVVSIEEKDIAGKRQSFYVLRLLDTDHKIMVPVANASSIGLRKPISEAEIRRIFQILKVKDVPIDTQTWNRRQRAFVEKLSTGSVFEVAEVMRDLERVKDVKDALSFSERQMLERARQLLVKEIAVSRNKSDDAIRAQIDAVFGGASRQTPVKSN